MKYFDLHCDTVSKVYELKTTFDDTRLHINSAKIASFEKYCQCFALWQDDSKKGNEAFLYAKKLLEIYKKQIEVLKSDTFQPILTLENAVSLGDSLDNIHFWKNEGVKMISLTWNGENALGFGAMSENKALKPFGKSAVREMETAGITLDVSHLSEKGFASVCDIAEKPFVASHSNCCDICAVPRNLKRWQIQSIIDIKGLIGINFYSAFLGNGKFSVFQKIYEHIYYLLSLGAENCIAVGSDFDGARMDESIGSLSKALLLYEFLREKGLSEAVLSKMFYDNANAFWEGEK